MQVTLSSWKYRLGARTCPRCSQYRGKIISAPLGLPCLSPVSFLPLWIDEFLTIDWEMSISHHKTENCVTLDVDDGL